MNTDSSNRPDSRRLAAIALLLAAGVMTGAQLGKIAPLIGWYQADLGFSLVAAGWLAAILGVFIALVALPAGWLIDRIGLVRSILIGAVALAMGGVLLAAAREPALAFAARSVEAGGYLLLCIALPALLAAISPLHWKGPVLAIWSGFVPLGFATSDFVAGAMLPVADPSAFLLVMALGFVLVAAGALVSLRGMTVAGSAGAQGGLMPTLSREVVLLSAGFGAFVVLSVSMFIYMPTFVGSAGAYYLVPAGAIALSVPFGNVLAGVLVRGKGAAFMGRLAVIGFAISAATAVPAFTLTDPVLATLSALMLAVSGALVASAQFAAIPFVTPQRGSVSVALGLVCQAGGIGTVFGPPIAATVIERAGWAGLGWFLTAVALVGLACMAPLMRSQPQNSAIVPAK
jgi:MFS family permease